MGKNSRIEWTHNTFNPWWGCSKVSPACENCYAETWAKRVGKDIWGRSKDRRFFTDKHWKEPIKWNGDALASGERSRVFCASMADVFERRSDLRESRKRLWDLIEQTPQLDWLLLTKRPQNIVDMVPWSDNWPINIWLGTTVETQRFAQERIPHLLKHAASVRFLSCEPLLGPLDLSEWLRPENPNASVNWVIAGGESGPKSRPMNPEWVRNLRDQCIDTGVAFHFKQWGHWVPRTLLTSEQLKISMVGDSEMAAAGKKLSGRNLDGRTWDELPVVA